MSGMENKFGAALPLQGIRVLEMGRLIAAPFCAQVLGDLGADVIKIERMGLGDDVRSYGPPFLNNQAAAGASAYYLACNRNKRSIAIDFGQPEGAELIRRLAGASHVFIENFKVRSLAKYGLDEPSIRKFRPDLIYLSVSGFGATGAYAHRPATDAIAQGMSGLMSITGEPDGPPSKVGVPIADIVTGLYSAIGVISALYQNATSPRLGEWVGVSLLDAAMAAAAPASIWSYLAGRPYLRVGNESMESAPAGVFRCRDGEILLQAGKDPDFAKLCGVLGLENLIQDARFAKRSERLAHALELKAILQEEMGKWDRASLYSAFVEVGVICGPINNVAEAMNDPQVIANDVMKPAGHPEDASLRLPSSPIRFSSGAPGITRYPPRVGEHTSDVLHEVLGMDGHEIAALEDRKIIGSMHGARS